MLAAAVRMLAAILARTTTALLGLFGALSGLLAALLTVAALGTTATAALAGGCGFDCGFGCGCGSIIFTAEL